MNKVVNTDPSRIPLPNKALSVVCAFIKGANETLGENMPCTKKELEGILTEFLMSLRAEVFLTDRDKLTEVRDMIWRQHTDAVRWESSAGIHYTTGEMEALRRVFGSQDNTSSLAEHWYID